MASVSAGSTARMSTPSSPAVTLTERSRFSRLMTPGPTEWVTLASWSSRTTPVPSAFAATGSEPKTAGSLRAASGSRSTTS